MSKVALSGNASGTGTFTIASPNSNSDRTLTLPDADGTVQVSGNPISGTTGTFSGDLSFNSGYGSAAVAYGCRAWVNFNGTGTVAIRASGNVSSITDGGTGIYTVNFTTAMADGNFSTNITANDIDWGSKVAIVTYGTTSVQLYTLTGSGSTGNRADASTVCVSIFR
jgi:uncharacterized protein (AIM24 family)